MTLEAWVRLFFNFEANPERLIALVLGLGAILAYSHLKARRAAVSLKMFVSATDEFELRGTAPKSLRGLGRSLVRSMGEWWSSSEGVLDGIGKVLLFGYIVPTLVLIVLMSVGTWLSCDSPIFRAEVRAECGVRLEDISANAMYRQVDAASFGALSGFNLLEPSVSVRPTGLTGKWIYYGLGAFAAIVGSLSLLQLIARWIGNLLRRWRFKFEKYAKYRQSTVLRSLRQPVGSR